MKESSIVTEKYKRSKRVERQVVLPLSKSVEIAFKSIRVRFFRSLITVMSLVLAVSLFNAE